MSHIMAAPHIEGLPNDHATSTNGLTADAAAHTNRVGLDPKDVLSPEGAVYALIAVVLFITGIVSGIGGVLILAGIATLIAVGYTVLTAARSLSAPTQAD